MDGLHTEQVTSPTAGQSEPTPKPTRRRFVRYTALGVAGGLLGVIGLSRGNYGSLVETSGGWQKVLGSPVLGGALGTCFDLTLLKEGDIYRMWFSWRPKASIAYTESQDGLHWSEPTIALGPQANSGWENEVNRPTVIRRGSEYQMWYTGQTESKSAIGYAVSSDGETWQRAGGGPVLKAEQAWEKQAVMCPSVLWDEPSSQYQMWYSGGEQYEPDAIGYATSQDGVSWQKREANPIFQSDSHNFWEQYKVTACQILRDRDWYLMFYIGFSDDHHAQIGIARSRDGLTKWQRHPANPIIRPSPNQAAWDHDAVYKPYVIQEKDRWLLWYNGRRDIVEQIGLVSHAGLDLGFE